jgi:hypothetical protein
MNYRTNELAPRRRGALHPDHKSKNNFSFTNDALINTHSRINKHTAFFYDVLNLSKASPGCKGNFLGNNPHGDFTLGSGV